MGKTHLAPVGNIYRDILRMLIIIVRVHNVFTHLYVTTVYW